MSTVLLDSSAMRRTLGRIAHEILEANQGGDDLVVIGVLRGGYPVAKRLAFLMTQVEGTTIPCGKVDISRFRDDTKSEEDESEVPFQVNGKHVVLVDEVIFTGRTIRAAIDAIFKFGRPSRISLAVLIDRGHRELPIQPDFCGKQVVTERTDHIKVRTSEGGEEEGAWQYTADELEALVR